MAAQLTTGRFAEGSNWQQDRYSYTRGELREKKDCTMRVRCELGSISKGARPGFSSKGTDRQARDVLGDC